MQAHHYFGEVLQTRSGPYEEETHEFGDQDRYEVEINELVRVAFIQQEFDNYCLAEHVEYNVEEEEVGKERAHQTACRSARSAIIRSVEAEPGHGSQKLGEVEFLRTAEIYR